MNWTGKSHSISPITYQVTPKKGGGSMIRLAVTIVEIVTAILVTAIMVLMVVSLLPAADRFVLETAIFVVYVLAVYTSISLIGEVTGQEGNLWFALAGAVFGGVVAWAAGLANASFTSGFSGLIGGFVGVGYTLGPILAAVGYNIGPRAYRFF
jgi:hypothetical protein